jgi:hypothetical protein
MAYRTLSDLRSALAARLGMGAQGAAGGVIVPNLNAILYSAQVRLYWKQDWDELMAWSDETLPAGESLLDYPAWCEPRRILRISVNRGTSGAPLWSEPLKKGIDIPDYNDLAIVVDYPRKFNAFAQLEFLPTYSQDCTLRIWAMKPLERFTQDSDRTTIDDELVFQDALAYAKAHYRHPDAQAVAGQAADLLAQVRGDSFQGKRFLPRDRAVQEYTKPKVV